MKLNAEQEKLVTEYMSIKKHVKACFNMKAFIEIMKECIDNCEHFEFSSERAKKFIDLNKPIFILKTNLVNKNDTMNMSPNEVDSLLDRISQVVNQEIIIPISEKMLSTIKDPERYKELLNINKELVDLCISNVYKIRIDHKRGVVQLEYFDI